MKRVMVLLLAICMLFSGCAGFLDGSYVSVKPHQEQSNQPEGQNVNVSNYSQLYRALEIMVEGGVENRVISLAYYDQTAVRSDVSRAIRQIRKEDPIAAYAVEEITYELGSSSGQPAAAVNIRYLHDRSQIRKIKKIWSMDIANNEIQEALNSCADSIVLYLYNYVQTDFVQLVEDYAAASPQTVMEVPQVTVNLFPETGKNRVVELKFTYQNSREDLRSMQNEVRPVFASAMLYVSGDGAPREKFSQLYSFLMERYDYQLETSITPAYSLLRHGVGDAKAFATIYAAMCNAAGLECRVVTGTRRGEPWCWNMICEDGVYSHLDLLRCSQELGFRGRTDAQMEGYVWDYSAFPECLPQVQPPTETIPEETVPAETDSTQPETEPTEAV